MENDPTQSPLNTIPPQPVGPSQPPIYPEAQFAPEQPWWRKKLLVVVLAAVLVLGGGAAAAYYGYVVPNQPNNVVLKAFTNLVTSPEGLDSFHATFTTDSSPTGGAGQTTYTLKGGIDNDFNIRTDVEFSLSTFKVTTASVTRTGDKAIYIRIQELPSLLDMLGAGEMASLKSLARKLDNSWVRISVDDLEKAGLLDKQQAADANRCVNAISEYLTSKQGELRSALADAYKQNPFANATKAGGETINNIPTTKYQLAIDRSKLKGFNQSVESFLKSSGSGLATACGTDEEETSEALAETEIGDTTVWISKDKQVVRFATNAGAGGSVQTQTIDFDGEAADTSQPASILTIADLQTEIEKAFSAGLGDLGSL